MKIMSKIKTLPRRVAQWGVVKPLDGTLARFTLRIMNTRAITSVTFVTLATLVAIICRLHAKDVEPSAATKDAPFINSLGMEFVPVPGTKVLFCRTETRVKDFEAFAKASDFRQGGWRNPGFEQGRDHPVVSSCGKGELGRRAGLLCMAEQE